MAGGLQLVAISNIGKNLKNDYSSLTALVSNPPDINSLVPYIKITDIDSNRILYDTTKWLHNLIDADIVLDLLNMDIEVGKNGYPSLISGSIKFKILNANKFITEDNDIRIPGLFGLLSYKNVQFGWADPRFSFFDEDVIEMKFDTTADTQNTNIITMHIGTPLQYFNKIEHAFISKLKDSSNLNAKPREKFTLNYNGKTVFSNQTAENIVKKELNKPYGDISYLKMFDNIMYDFDGKYSYKSYSLTGTVWGIKTVFFFIPLTTDVDSVLGIEHLFARYYSPDQGSTLSNSSTGDLYRFDGQHHYTESWYGNFVDFSSFNPDNRIYKAIIPRISKYQDIQDNASLDLYLLRGKLFDLLNGNPTIYDFSLREIENAPQLPLFTNLYQYESYKGVPTIVENEYYRKFLYNKTNSPYVRNYNFNPDGTPKLSTDNRTIERDRVERLIAKHIQYILELRKIAGDLYTKSTTDAISPLELKLLIRDVYVKLSEDVFTDEEYINLMRPIEINVEQYEFKQLSENEFVHPSFRIPNEAINRQNDITVVDAVTLLELNYRVRNQFNPFYQKFEWITLIQSLDDFRKETGEDKNPTPVSPRTGLSQDVSEKLVTIYDCMLFFGTYINRWIGKPVPTDWVSAYYAIMVDSEEEKEQIKKQMEEEQEKEEPVEELSYDKANLFTAYELKNNLRLKDIVNDLNTKMEEVLEPKYLIQIKIYNGNPNLPQDRAYELSWSEDSERKISILGKYEEGETIEYPNTPRLEHLLVPKTLYDNILQDNESLFGILRDIFKHFSNYFNLNLEFSIYREKGTTTIEIFCIDLITEAINNWSGNTDFAEITGVLEDKFIAFDYRANNSIITKLSANVQTQDSLFLSFMPAQTEGSLLALFNTASDRYKQGKLSDSAIDNLVAVYSKMFKPIQNVSTSQTKFEGMINNVQQYVKTNKLSTLLKEKDLLNDIDFLEAVVKFYNASGTYPAHLLFGGYSITLELLGLNGFASFQIVGLRNSGIYDGIYMIEKARHYIDKTTFTTTLDMKLLAPRIRAFSTQQ